MNIYFWYCFIYICPQAIRKNIFLILYKATEDMRFYIVYNQFDSGKIIADFNSLDIKLIVLTKFLLILVSTAVYILKTRMTISIKAKLNKSNGHKTNVTFYGFII